MSILSTFKRRNLLKAFHNNRKVYLVHGKFMNQHLKPVILVRLFLSEKIISAKMKSPDSGVNDLMK